MDLSSILFGNKDKISQVSTQTGQQQQQLGDLLKMLQQMQGSGGNYQQSQDYLSRMLGGDQQSYENWAAPYKTQFQEQTIPRLAEKFAGLGGGLGGGALGSSGFGQAIGGAASGFQSNLANLYANLQQQAAQQAMGQFNNLQGLGLGTRSFENIYQPGSTGLVGNVLSGAAQGLTGGIGMAAGNKLMNWFTGGNTPQNTTT